MRLLSKKNKNDPTNGNGSGTANGTGTPISAKSERGGSKGRNSLTKLLHGIDRSYHGSKFSTGGKSSNKQQKDASQNMADLLERSASKDSNHKDEHDDDQEEGSTSPETIRSAAGNYENDVNDVNNHNHNNNDLKESSHTPSSRTYTSRKKSSRGRGRGESPPESADRRAQQHTSGSDRHHGQYDYSSNNKDEGLEDPEDIMPLPAQSEREKRKLDRAKEKARNNSDRDRYDDGGDDVDRDRTSNSTGSRRSSSQHRSPNPSDALRKSRHGSSSRSELKQDSSLRKSRHGGDSLRTSRHGNSSRASTGDLSRSRHGGGINSMRNASSAENLLGKSRHGNGKERTNTRERRSREKEGDGDSGAEDGLRQSRHGRRRGQQVVDALTRGPHGDESEDADALKKSRHGSSSKSRGRGRSDRSSVKGEGDDQKDRLRKSRHGDSMSKSRHGGSSMSKSRHGGTSMSKSRHGGGSRSMRKSRHGGRNDTDIHDLLASSRHGARVSSELDEHEQLRESEEASVSVCCVCGEPARTYLQALNKKYHHECFNCVGCHEPIDPTAPFTYMSEGGEKHPLHMSCHSELYGMKCTVCLNPIPAGADGKIKYTKHPFFSNEVMCPTHVVESVEQAGGNVGGASRKNRPVRRCTSCHRFEPFKGKGFLDLGDLDRCVCMACCRTIVCDSVDAQPLWRKVLRFWEKNLNMPIWEGMKEVPILVVGSDVMTEQVMFGEAAGTTHHHSGMTRGLCLSEQQATNLPASVTEDGKPLPAQKSSDLTAILCLTGLPSDLTASVLAHEAMHAWFKLHPEFGASERAIPPHVEEGCAQLIAHLYLTEREASASGEKTSSKDEGPSDDMLRQYFKFSIESDASEIYGDGFREASRAYSEVGLEMLLNHVAYYRDLPDL
jgi:hypothetical protein